MKTKFIISINDGYVEYAMPLEVDDDESIHSIAEKILARFDNDSSSPQLVRRVNTEYAALVRDCLT